MARPSSLRARVPTGTAALAGILLGAVALPLAARAADPLPPPSGEVLLVVDGRIAVTNVGDEAHLDRALLERIGTIELATETPWTAGEPTFSGVSGAALLDRLGAEGEVAVARALNDYVVTIPLEDLRSYDVLFATRQDGRELTPRDKGPIWVVYPWTDHPELNTRQIQQRSIWQLNALTIR